MRRSNLGLFSPLIGIFIAQWFTGVMLDFLLDILVLGGLALWVRRK